MVEGLLGLLIVLALVGLVVWVLTTAIPMPEPYRRVLVAVAVIVMLLIVLRWALGAGAVIWPH